MKKLFLIIFSVLLTMSFALNETYGKASWYGHPYHGRKAASGEIYNMNSLTAAHRTLKFGTKLKVTNIANNKSVVVRINDRGPFVKGKILDLSKVAFQQIASSSVGVINIKYNVIE